MSLAQYILWKIFRENIEDPIVSYLLSYSEPALNAKTNTVSIFSNPVNELESIKGQFRYANVRAFNLCTFGRKKSCIEFDFACVSEVDSLYFFTPVRMLLREKYGKCAKIQEAGSQA